MKRKILWVINHCEEIFCNVSLTLMIVSLLAQIYFRYIVGKSLPWSEEISRIAFLALVFSANSLSAKNKSHIRVTFQLKFLPSKIRKAIELLGDAIWIVFNCAIVYIGYKVFLNMGEYKFISPVLGWDLKYVFIIIPISFALMTLRILQNYYQDYIRTKRQEGGNSCAS